MHVTRSRPTVRVLVGNIVATYVWANVLTAFDADMSAGNHAVISTRHLGDKLALEKSVNS